MITRQQLEAHDCWENVDRVPGDPETTAFKRRARLHQAIWREARSLPEGTEPTRPRAGETPRPLGSRIEVKHAKHTGANFISNQARRAATARVECPEPNQTLMTDRLYADLLSSMPLCFNLFGPFWAEPELASNLIGAWLEGATGALRAVRFEWSPGRLLAGRFLENRTSFDVAFEICFPDGTLGTIGIETKYHEHCKREEVPSAHRLRRYGEVAARSNAFRAGATEALVGGPLQQIWLDHLLALSLLQDKVSPRRWVKFVLVHPARNPSYARAAAEYQSYLTDPSTFEVMTLERLLAVSALPEEFASAFRARYLWDSD
jgi:hypothetical protein